MPPTSEDRESLGGGRGQLVGERISRGRFQRAGGGRGEEECHVAICLPFVKVIDQGRPQLVLRARGGGREVLEAKEGRGQLLRAGSGKKRTLPALWAQSQLDLNEFEVVPRSIDVVGNF